MKTKKEIKFNHKSGMALPGVMILLVVLSLLGTAMYAYSMQSVRSVRYASDGKKAEYLARAGIEATAYAYQVAMNSTGTDANGLADFMGEIADGSTHIESNTVWLVYDKTTREYVYLKDTRTQEQQQNDQENGVEWPSSSSYDIIGNFVVVMYQETKEDTIRVYNYDENGQVIGNPDGVDRALPSNIKLLTATGTAVNGAKRQKTAYLTDVMNAYKRYYGDNGIIDGKYASTSSPSEVAYGNNSTPAGGCSASTPFIYSGSYKTSSTLTFRFKWLNKIFGEGIQPDPQTVASETVPFSLAYSAGNLVLDKPKNAKNISFVSGQSNMVSFVSRNNIFVRTGIDTTSTDGHFNTCVLKGNKIVVDGDINVAAYGFTRTSSMALINNIGVLSDLMKQKYRYATLTIDALNDTDISNPYHGVPYTYDRSGVIYFGGNVFVNITLPNVGTYRYKAFSAGDAYYFDADVHASYINNLGSNAPESTDLGSDDGIDLFRYFLEYSIATKKYSKNVLDRFSDLIEFYYGNSSEAQVAEGETGKAIFISGNEAVGAYFKFRIDTSTGHGTGNKDDILYNAMRKIDIKNTTYGDTPRDIIPPKPSDASSIKWGTPKAVDLNQG